MPDRPRSRNDKGRRGDSRGGFQGRDERGFDNRGSGNRGSDNRGFDNRARRGVNDREQRGAQDNGYREQEQVGFRDRGFGDRERSGSSTGEFGDREQDGSRAGGFADRKREGSRAGGFADRKRAGSRAGGFDDRERSGSRASGSGNREQSGSRDRGFRNADERGARASGPRERREDDGTEMIFGKNAVLAFLEDNEGDDSESDSEFEHDSESGSESESESETNAKSRSKSDSANLDDAARKYRTEQPRGQVRKPEIGKIYMVTIDHPDRKIDRIKQLAKSQRIPVVICDRRKLDWLVGPDQVHQGIAAQISAAEFWELSDFLAELKKSSPDTLDGSVLAIVDGIEDPHNLGAIIRVAESAGLKGLLLPARRSAGLTGIVAKTSAGALASLPIVRIHNLVQALEELKESGFWIAGLDSNQGDLYTKVDLVRPLALVVGSEGTGMTRLVKDNCDMLLKIPMLGKTESLNASVAAGIVFYEVVRQLQSKGLLS